VFLVFFNSSLHPKCFHRKQLELIIPTKLMLYQSMNVVIFLLLLL
jgi:hypothetical protein